MEKWMRVINVRRYSEKLRVILVAEVLKSRFFQL